jgi:hypothetical protein
MAYSKFGSLILVPVADLQNLNSQANRNGATNSGPRSANDPNFSGSVSVGGPGTIGKRKGVKIAVDVGSGAIGVAQAAGDKSSDLWRLIDGTTAYTPVNVLNPGGGAAWTLTTATYTGGVFTVATNNAQNATQTVALKAGRYRLSGTVGKRAANVSPKLTVTQSTGSVVLLTKLYNSVPIDAASVKVDSLSDQFTVLLDSNVVFDLTVRTDADASTTGAAWISFILEAA